MIGVVELLIAGLVLAITYIILKLRNNINHYDKVIANVPYITTLKQSGSGAFLRHLIPPDQGDLLKQVVQQHEQSGVGVSKANIIPGLLPPMLVVTDQNIGEKIWNTKHTSIEKPPHFMDIYEKMLGNSLFTSPAETWKYSRRLLAKCFHYKQLESYFDVYNQEAEVMIKYMKENIAASKPMKWSKKINCCSLDIALKTLMGQDVGVQSHHHTTGKDNRTQHLFDNDISDVTGDRVFAIAEKPWLQINFVWKLLAKEEAARWKYASDEIMNWIRKITEEGVARINSGGDIVMEASKDRSFMSVMAEEIVAGNLAVEPAVEHIFNFWFASHDTSSNSMSLVLPYIAKNRRVFKKLQAEVDEHFAPCSSELNVDYDTLNKMKYLGEVIKEFLRMASPVPVAFRRIVETLKLTDDITVEGSYEKPIDALLCIRAMAYDKAIWGEDVYVFRPERHAEKNRQLPTFGQGLRNCLGKNFAMNMIKTLLCHIVSNFDMECLDDDLAARKINTKFIWHYEEEVNMKFTVREPAN